MSKKLRSSFILILGILFFSNTIVSHSEPHYHHPQQFLKKIANDPKAGEKIYEHYCALCHAKEPRIPLGAPRIGVKADWAVRAKPGIDYMLKRIDGGLGAMPARGGCFECSDKLLKAAIQYMLPH